MWNIAQELVVNFLNVLLDLLIIVKKPQPIHKNHNYTSRRIFALNNFLKLN